MNDASFKTLETSNIACSKTNLAIYVYMIFNFNRYK